MERAHTVGQEDHNASTDRGKDSLQGDRNALVNGLVQR